MSAGAGESLPADMANGKVTRALRPPWPRLSSTIEGNNVQNSTWWMYDNSFIRLKSAEVAYNVPKDMLKKIRMTNVRLYVNGTNLVLISKFKLWDPEMGNNPLAYPIQRVVNVGVNIGL